MSATATSSLFNSTNDVMTSDVMFEVTNVTVALSHKVKALISAEQFAIFGKVSLVFWLVISLFGFNTNILNIRTFTRMGPDDSISVLFLALSISDFAICNLAFGEATSTVFDIVSYDYDIVWAVQPNIPRLYMFTLRRILTVVTIFITSFLAIQRCLCVVIPLKIKGMFTLKITYVYLFASFLFAAVPYCLYVAQYKVDKYYDTARNMTRYKLASRGFRTNIVDFVSVGMGIVLNVTAQAVINVCLIVMGYGLKKSIQFRKSATSAHKNGVPAEQQVVNNSDIAKDKALNKEGQALIQVTIVSTIFVVTNCPFLLVALVGAIVPEIDLYGPYSNLYVVLYRIMSIIEIVNSSFNFFVYYKYNSKFRKYCFVAKDEKAKQFH